MADHIYKYLELVGSSQSSIEEAIQNTLSRGATALKSRGLYQNVEREVIVAIVTLKELGRLQELIRDIDPEAFVVINNVHEVLGNGFRRRIWNTNN